MHIIALIAVLALFVDPAFAQAVEEPSTNEGIWRQFNCFLCNQVLYLLQFWPQTPEHMKVSNLVNTLQVLAPWAPWYLLIQFVSWCSVPISFVALYKAVKLVWP